jgi:hypothetical protein
MKSEELEATRRCEHLTQCACYPHSTMKTYITLQIQVDFGPLCSRIKRLNSACFHTCSYTVTEVMRFRSINVSTCENSDLTQNPVPLKCFWIDNLRISWFRARDFSFRPSVTRLPVEKTALGVGEAPPSSRPADDGRREVRRGRAACPLPRARRPTADGEARKVAASYGHGHQ